MAIVRMLVQTAGGPLEAVAYLDGVNKRLVWDVDLEGIEEGVDSVTLHLASATDLEGKVDDAPSDGTTYGRKNAAWIDVGTAIAAAQDSATAAGEAAASAEQAANAAQDTADAAGLAASSAQDDATSALAGLLLRVLGYTSAGAAQGLKLWIGSTTSDGSGAWSVDISAAGFASVLGAIPACVLSTATVTDRAWATLASVSTSTITGYTVRGITLVVLGATIRTAPSVPVYVLVVGT